MTDDSLTTLGAAYLKKLKASGKPRQVVLAFLLLLEACLRHARLVSLHPTAPRRLDFSVEAQVLAKALSASAAQSLGVPALPTPVIAAALKRDLAAAVAHAVSDLPAPSQDRTYREALRTRFAVIAVAETQQATATAIRSTAVQNGVQTIRREYTSPNPCDRCAELAGVYTAPFPDELWESHPNCCCIWSRGPEGIIER